MRVYQREYAADRLPKFLPTQHEIHRSCLAIQATWSEAERRRRCAYMVEAEVVELSTMKVRDLIGYSQSDD